jgi:hypothetical protein
MNHVLRTGYPSSSIPGDCAFQGAYFLFGIIARPPRFSISIKDNQTSTCLKVELIENPGLWGEARFSVRRITARPGILSRRRPFYIVFTSNIGPGETMRMESAPFALVERTVLMRVRERLRPELVGRVNEMVMFSRLDYATHARSAWG